MRLNVGDVDLVLVGKRLLKEIGDDDISGSAAEMSYRFFLALFPFFLLLSAMGSFAADAFNIANPTDEVMNLVGDSLPSEAAVLLREQVEAVVTERNPALLSVGIVGTLWAASSAIQTIMKALNRAHEVKETRSMVKRYALALGLTLTAGLFILGGFVVLLSGQLLGEEIAGRIGLEGAAVTFFPLARWPLVALALLAAMAFIYWAAPNIKLPFKWISPGALMFTVLWLVGTYVFGLYVSNFGSYSATYGALGSVVILLVWLYWTSFIMLAGAELNGVLAQEAIPEELPARAGEATTSETVPNHRQGELAGTKSEGILRRAQVRDGERAPSPIIAIVLTVAVVIMSFADQITGHRWSRRSV